MLWQQKVLLIVPHQDDEINVLGGIFEEFIKYGSTVHIVYAITNGTIQGFRYTEALNLCKHIGIRTLMSHSLDMDLYIVKRRTYLP